MVAGIYKAAGKPGGRFEALQKTSRLICVGLSKSDVSNFCDMFYQNGKTGDGL